VQGHWAIRDESINDSFIRPEADREKLNLGFAIVVPAKKILEVLNQPALIKIREEFAASGGRQSVRLAAALAASISQEPSRDSGNCSTIRPPRASPTCSRYIKKV
jgi:hypothetical protein